MMILTEVHFPESMLKPKVMNSLVTNCMGTALPRPAGDLLALPALPCMVLGHDHHLRKDPPCVRAGLKIAISDRQYLQQTVDSENHR